MSLSRELIVAAKARADAATEGPWMADEGAFILKPDKPGSAWGGTIIAQVLRDDFGLVEEANTEFIAASREDVPVMADALLRVLDLHTPEPCEIECCGGLLRCLECGQSAPCATVRAMTGDSVGP